MVTVRYIVKDVPESAEFYSKHLGFTIALDARPVFACIVLRFYESYKECAKAASSYS